MKRALTIGLAITALIALACGPGGGRDENVQPPRPQPPAVEGARNIFFGAQIRSATDGAPTRGRITMTIDAIDSAGGKGSPFRKVYPWDGEVNSGHEEYLTIVAGFPRAVIVSVTATVVGREPGEVVECWIRGDEYEYFDQDAVKVKSHGPHTAKCTATIAPLPGVGG